MNQKFKLTDRQVQATELLSGDATHEMLWGGSRSGKTALLVKLTINRALKSKASRHSILRFRYNAIKQSIMMDTFPKIMRLAFDGIEYQLNKSDSFASFANGSEIWFGGLDDKERVEKILGNEYATIYLNECSQISWSARNVVLTRLAQKAVQNVNGVESELKPRMFYDCNPPSKNHWSYKLFIQKVDPESGLIVPNPHDFASMQMNPLDNTVNLSENYLSTLESMPARMRKRFLLGEFADATPNALFSDENIDTYRVTDGKLPQLIRIVVAVDPSGAGEQDTTEHDEIGIAIVGLGIDGNAYVLEDCTINGSPKIWGKLAVDAYVRHQADVMVGEQNYGGGMVEYVIKSIGANINYKIVTASRGKVQRAEPISALYEQGKVRHVGYFAKLEEELTAFSTGGYMGAKSPNRADALIWALTELFSGIVSPRVIHKEADLYPQYYD